MYPVFMFFFYFIYCAHFSLSDVFSIPLYIFIISFLIFYVHFYCNYSYFKCNSCKHPQGLSTALRPPHRRHCCCEILWGFEFQSQHVLNLELSSYSGQQRRPQILVFINGWQAQVVNGFVPFLGFFVNSAVLTRILTRHINSPLITDNSLAHLNVISILLKIKDAQSTDYACTKSIFKISCYLTINI